MIHHRCPARAALLPPCRPAASPTDCCRFGTPLCAAPRRPAYVVNDVNGKPNPFAARGVEALWENAVLFPWKQGDVLILDNVSAMHARMPCTDPSRKILTAIADQYTIECP